MAAAIAAASRAQDKSIVGLSREAADQLLQYPWPGNLRQLQRVIHTAVAITEGEIIEPDAILLETSVEEVRAEDTPRAAAAAATAPSMPMMTSPSAPPRRGTSTRSSISSAATSGAPPRALGLSRSTLDRKLSEH